jgi:hypothetical protein
MIRETNLVFTRILSFRGGTSEFIHAFCHSCHPFPLFLVHVIIFYKMDYASLIEIEVIPTQILESLVAYWQHLNMACPQHAPTNGVVNPNTSHDTREVNIVVLVERLPSFIFDIRNNLSIEPMFCKDFIHL